MLSPGSMLTACGGGVAPGAAVELPQLPQNAMLSCIWAPHFGQKAILSPCSFCRQAICGVCIAIRNVEENPTLVGYPLPLTLSSGFSAGLERMWDMQVPETNASPEQIATNKRPYYEALEKADEAGSEDRIDISAREEYLSSLLAKQLLPVLESATASRLNSGFRTRLNAPDSVAPDGCFPLQIIRLLQLRLHPLPVRQHLAFVLVHLFVEVVRVRHRHANPIHLGEVFLLQPSHNLRNRPIAVDHLMPVQHQLSRRRRGQP